MNDDGGIGVGRFCRFRLPGRLPPVARRGPRRREFAVDPPVSSGPEEPDRHGPSGPLDHAERAEYERLRLVLGTRHRRLRLCGASLLLTLAVLLAPVSVVATWINSEVTDVDRYEQTVSPLARDPAVQDLMIDRVTDGLVENIDARKITDGLADALADRDAPRFLVDAARSLDEQLKGGLTTGVRYAVEKVVTSDAFAQAWDAIHRGAHTAATNVLTGRRRSARGQGRHHHTERRHCDRRIAGAADRRDAC